MAVVFLFSCCFDLEQIVQAYSFICLYHFFRKYHHFRLVSASLLCHHYAKLNSKAEFSYEYCSFRFYTVFARDCYLLYLNLRLSCDHVINSTDLQGHFTFIETVHSYLS